jgi:hypothetical protein
VDDGGGDARFVVDVTDDAGVLAGYWHSLGTAGLDDNSQVDPYAVTLTPGAPGNLTADFGYYVQPGALGNYVWIDENTNGIQDADEPGLDDAAVTLEIDYPDGTSVTLVTLSGDDPGTPGVEQGWYAFGNLLLDEDYNGDGLPPEPDYTLSVETPVGLLPTEVDVDSNTRDMEDSDNHTGVSAQPAQGLTDTSAQADPNTELTIASYDFGFVAPTGVSILLFEATAQDGASVQVAWLMGRQNGIEGFNLHRSESEGGERALLNEASLPVEPSGIYGFLDDTVAAGATYYYWLELVPDAGSPYFYAIPAGVEVPGILEPRHTIYLPMIMP